MKTRTRYDAHGTCLCIVLYISTMIYKHLQILIFNLKSCILSETKIIKTKMERNNIYIYKILCVLEVRNCLLGHSVSRYQPDLPNVCQALKIQIILILIRFYVMKTFEEKNIII